MTTPMVFISYSHDSPDHEAKVLEFANRLRGDGIHAVLDQYESFPPGGWIQWMKRQVRDADFIVVSVRKLITGERMAMKRPVSGLASPTRARSSSRFFTMMAG